MSSITSHDPPWAQSDWLQQTTAWIEDRLHGLGLAATGPVEVVQMWSISCVLRMPATGGAVYFKAMPPCFAQEPPLTRALAQSYPEHIPHVLAIRDTEHGMLMRDIGGTALAAFPTLPQWEQTVRLLARMQIDYSQRTDELRSLGCPIRPVATLVEDLNTVLSQVLPAVTPYGFGLDEAERAAIETLVPQIAAACEQLAAAAIPLTLAHGDLNASNIALAGPSSTTPVIFDWSDGTVAHPFFDLLILFEGTAFEQVAQHRTYLRDVYLDAWTAAGYGAREFLVDVFEVAQALAPIYHAASYSAIFAQAGAAAPEQLGSGIPWLLRMLAPNKPRLLAG